MNFGSKTKIYGLIGYPVKHTFSPLMHNALFKKFKMNATYVPFEVRPEELKSKIRYMKCIGISGLNVTIPHKENVVKYLDRVDKEAALIGAVNTIVLKGGKFKGFNTDGRGFIKSLEEEFAISPRRKKFFIMGAGGVSRAISFSLALSGAKRIVLLDDIKTKAIRLAKSLEKNTKGEVIALEKDKKAMKELILDSDVFINATPCGMKKSDSRLINPKFLHKKLFVCDVIYNPPATRLLKDAKKKGARTLNGLSMLINQGAISFNLWTGRKASLDVMRKAIKCRK